MKAQDTGSSNKKPGDEVPLPGGARGGFFNQKQMSLKTKIIPYNPELKTLAKQLRRNMTLSEVLLWNELRKKQMLGYDFDRQRPIDNFIVDFYCKELSLVIEIDGDSHIYRNHYDDERQKTLEKLGVHFLRFDDLEVKRNMNNVLRVIENWIIKYKPTPNPSGEGNPINENPAKYKRPTPGPSGGGEPATSNKQQASSLNPPLASHPGGGNPKD